MKQTHIQVNLYATFSAHFPPFCGYIRLGEKVGQNLPMSLHM